MANDEFLPEKIGSREIYTANLSFLKVKASTDGEENAKRIRQLLFMARLTHGEKTLEDVKQMDFHGESWNVISVGESTAGMDPNSNYFNVRYVEDLVD